MAKFCEIPREKFPLSDRAYNDLMDTIRTAARGFGDLGTAHGRLVDKDLMEVWARLNRTWNLIQEIEHRERALTAEEPANV